MKTYELVYIVHPDLETTIDKVTEKVTGFIERRNGKVLKQDNWEKKKLAYKILKQDFGIYVVVEFDSEPKSVVSIENDIRLSEEIIRFILVAKEEEVEGPIRKKPETRPVKEEAIEEKPKKAEKPKKETKEGEVEEKERLKKLDEKLDELIGKE